MVDATIAERIENFFGDDDLDRVATQEETEEFWHFIDSILQENGVLHGAPLAVEADGHQLVGNMGGGLLTQFMQPNPSANREYYQQLIDEKGLTYRNHWKLRGGGKKSFIEDGLVIIAEDQDGKIQKIIFEYRQSALNRIKIFLESGAARITANLVSAERRAREKLFSMLDEPQKMQYELNDSVLEVGKSGVFYWVRKGRPTLAMRVDDAGVRPITTLCLHPMGYYEGTFAGALVPTDDMIAHILYIRGDEHGFWKKANHIPLDLPQSGI